MNARSKRPLNREQRFYLRDLIGQTIAAAKRAVADKYRLPTDYMRAPYEPMAPYAFRDEKLPADVVKAHEVLVGHYAKQAKRWEVEVKEREKEAKAAKATIEKEWAALDLQEHAMAESLIFADGGEQTLANIRSLCERIMRAYVPGDKKPETIYPHGYYS